MQRLHTCWIVVLPVALLGGCRKPAPTQAPTATPAQSPSHEAVVEGAIASLRTAVAGMNETADAASAERTVQTLQREAQNLQSLRRRLVELGRASDAERGRVKRHSQDMIAASEEIKRVTAGLIAKIQTGRFPPDLAQRLADASRDYGQAMVDFGQQAMPLFE